MIPGDRLFCAFTSSHNVGDAFNNWPLHITIVPWFRTDMPSDVLGRHLSQQLQTLEPFQIEVAGEARMGHGRIVNLIRTPSPLETIEQTVRGWLYEQGAWLVDETIKKPREFRPHVTVQKDERTREGDTLIIDALYIVEQKGDSKEIVGRINL